jgi:hypothetical protein
MHDITGTSTITGFDTVRAGIWKIVKFEGALTLTHNATNLILPGAANVTTADGDIAIFFSEGSGNWRCVSYFRAANQPVQDTSATVKGVVELATDAETLTGTDTARAVTPANVKSVLGLTKLNSGSASGATLDIVMTSYTGYAHKLLVLDLVPATDSVTLSMQVSTDGGGSYLGGVAYNDVIQLLDDNGTSLVQNSTGGAQVRLSYATNIGNGSNEGISSVVTMFNTTSTAKWPKFSFDSAWISSDATPRFVDGRGGGAYRTAQDTDAVRISFSSGNITSGTWALYGYN